MQLFTESSFSAAKIGKARGSSNIMIRFNFVVILSLSYEGALELMLIELLCH
jgi:hypothetical protein